MTFSHDGTQFLMSFYGKARGAKTSAPLFCTVYFTVLSFYWFGLVLALYFLAFLKLFWGNQKRLNWNHILHTACSVTFMTLTLREKVQSQIEKIDWWMVWIGLGLLDPLKKEKPWNVPDLMPKIPAWGFCILLHDKNHRRFAPLHQKQNTFSLSVLPR